MVEFFASMHDFRSRALSARREGIFERLAIFGFLERQGGSERPGPTGRYVPAASRIIESYRGHDSPALAKLEASEKAARGGRLAIAAEPKKRPRPGRGPELAGGVGGGECRPRTPRGKRPAERGLPNSPGRRPPDRRVFRPAPHAAPIATRPIGVFVLAARPRLAPPYQAAPFLSLRAEQERVPRRRTIAPAETDGPIICYDRGRLSASYSVK